MAPITRITAAMIHFSGLPPGRRILRGAGEDDGAGPGVAEAGGAGAAMPSKTARGRIRFRAGPARIGPRQNRSPAPSRITSLSRSLSDTLRCHMKRALQARAKRQLAV